MKIIEKIHRAISNAIDDALRVSPNIGNAEIEVLRQQLYRAAGEIASIAGAYFRCGACKRVYFSCDDKNKEMPGNPKSICCDAPLVEIDPGEIIDALNMAAITSPPTFFECNKCGVLHEIRSIYLAYIKSREKIRSKGKFQQ